TAHLDSHPGDRSAFESLKVTRATVRESRIFEALLDPPQAVSALLLQEAHRRAPKRVVADDQKESWFARFVSPFMRHPAMAAAAMLVVVVSVAGTLYLRKGTEPAEQTAPVVATTESTAVSGSGAVAAATPTNTNGSAYSADLADDKTAQAAKDAVVV